MWVLLLLPKMLLFSAVNCKVGSIFFLPGKFNTVYPLHFKGHDHGVSATLHSGSETRALAGNQRWQTRMAYAVQLEGWKLECYAFAWVFVLILLSRQVLPPLASFAKLSVSSGGQGIEKMLSLPLSRKSQFWLLLLIHESVWERKQKLPFHLRLTEQLENGA